jgi:hypothetical protein
MVAIKRVWQVRFGAGSGLLGVVLAASVQTGCQSDSDASAAQMLAPTSSVPASAVSTRVSDAGLEQSPQLDADTGDSPGSATPDKAGATVPTGTTVPEPESPTVQEPSKENADASSSSSSSNMESTADGTGGTPSTEPMAVSDAGTVDDPEGIDAASSAATASTIDDPTTPPFTPGEAFPIALPRGDSNQYDPAVLQASNGSIYVAWSEDGELYVSRSPNGFSWSPAYPLTDSGSYEDIAPSLAEDDQGTLHLVWARSGSLACAQSHCPGYEDTLAHLSSADGINWSDSEDLITSGPRDSVPSVMFDRSVNRLRVVYASYQLGSNGGSPSQSAMYTTTLSDGSWSQPVALEGLSPEDDNDTYPFIAQSADGQFWLTWTRYAGDESPDFHTVLYSPTTETYVATSTDALQWSAPKLFGRVASSFFPSIFLDFDGQNPRVIYAEPDPEDETLTATGMIPATGTYPDDLSVLDQVGNWPTRVVPTRTAGIYFGVWLNQSVVPYQVTGKFFELP